MSLVDIFRQLRVHRTWNYKGPLLLAGPYCVLALTAAPAATALLAVLGSMLTIVGIAGLAYLINDLSDRDADRAAGKPNCTEGAGPGSIALAALVLLLVWCPRSNLKKFPMDFGPRQGARRSHSRAMAPTSNAAFGSKDAEIIQGNFGTPH